MSERDYDVLCAFSTKKQSAYATALLDASLNKSYPFLGPDLLEEEQGFVPNDDQIGVGEFATTRYQELKDCKLTRRWDCGSNMLGWVAAFGLGAVSTAQQGATAAYLHTIIPQTATQQLNATTIVEQQSTGIKNKIRDICVESFKISGKGKERLKLETNLVGSGHVATSALTMPALTADSFLRMHGVKFEIGVAASEVDVSARIKGFDFEWNNNPLLDDGYYPNSGQVRGRLHHGRRAAKLGFQLLLDANSVERTALLAGTLSKCIITVTGALIESTYYHKGIITIPALYYKALPIGSEDNMLLYNVETDIKYDSVIGYLVQFEVTNTLTALLDSEA
jgi:hypothetical protein